MEPRFSYSRQENREIQSTFPKIVSQLTSSFSGVPLKNNEFQLFQKINQSNNLINFNSLNNPTLSQIPEIKNIQTDSNFAQIYSPKIDPFNSLTGQLNPNNSSIFILSPTLHNIENTGMIQNNLFLSNQIDFSGKKFNYIVQPCQINSQEPQKTNLDQPFLINTQGNILNNVNQNIPYQFQQINLNNMIQPVQNNLFGMKSNNFVPPLLVYSQKCPLNNNLIPSSNLEIKEPIQTSVILAPQIYSSGKEVTSLYNSSQLIFPNINAPIILPNASLIQKKQEM